MDQEGVMTRAQLDKIKPLMYDKPITSLHKGWHKAMEMALAEADVPTSQQVVDKLKSLEKEGTMFKVWGNVRDYFSVPEGGYYAIFDVRDKTMADLVQKGAYQGVSLSHYAVNGDNALPGELTLCPVPGRKGSYVFASGPLEQLVDYKRKLVSRSVHEPTMSEQPPAMNEPLAEKDGLTKALEALEPEHRKFIQESLMNAVKNGEDMSKEIEKLKAEHKEVHVSNELLQNAIAEFRQLIDPETAKSFAIDLIPDRCGSADPEVHRRNLLTVVSASAHFLRRGGSAPRPEKRARVDEDEGAAAVDSTAAGQIRELLKAKYFGARS